MKKQSQSESKPKNKGGRPKGSGKKQKQEEPWTITDILERAATDFPFFCEFITITTPDPSVSPQESTHVDIPFKLKKHQREIADRVDTATGELVILKCRQIGVTQVVLAYILWKFLFHSSQTILFTIKPQSKQVEAIAKLQAMYQSLPHWLVAAFDIVIPQGGRCVNHSNGNTVHIETTTPNTGRSGTYSLAIVDEFAFADGSPNQTVQSGVLRSIRQSAKTKRIIISTPEREGDVFEALTKEADANGMLFKRTIHDVKDDFYCTPENAKLWWEYIEKTNKPSDLAREYLCEFRGAVANTVWFVDKTNPDKFFKQLPAGFRGPVLFSADVGFIDPTVILFARVINGALYVFKEAIFESHAAGSIADFLIQFKNENSLIYYYGAMDSSAKQKDWSSGMSGYQIVQRRVGCPIFTHKGGKEDMYNNAQDMFMNGKLFIDPIACPQLDKMLYNYEFDKEGKFRHDNYSHWHDALVYLCWNFAKVGIGRRTPLKVVNRRTFGL